jgi:NADH:ubiquinone oxidoreductase subunit 5 (subunit L)/multisubunit Na+/H+ antiporter MnhA subunit
LVTAGVYVLIRYHYLFVFFDYLILKIFFLGTMIVGGACAVVENDFKKIVAMSTLSQLGIMLYVLFMGFWVLSFLHMVVHAFYKRMLFLRTGSLISCFGGGQDSRVYGGDFFSFFCFLFFVVRCLCLMGFPFYVGFYTKDYVLFRNGFVVGLFFGWGFLGGCLLTILYRFRLLKSSFSGLVKGPTSFFFKEEFHFLFVVVFLFFKGWALGGLFC